MTLSSLSSRTELFDRNRLLIDLDEATDPSSPPAVLVVLGFPGRSGEPDSGEETPETAFLSELRDRFAGAVGNAGSTYRTRKNELCALIDGSFETADAIIGSATAGLPLHSRPLGAELAMGVVELPDEAPDAITALTIADRRMTASVPLDEPVPA